MAKYIEREALLKERMTNITRVYSGKRYDYLVSEKFIDDTVKETVGKNNGN